MRIGIDIDDTICISYEPILTVLRDYYRKDIPSIDTDVILENYCDYIEKKGFDYQNFAKQHYEKCLANAKLRDGALKYINKLKEDGHEIYVITGRSKKYYDDPYKFSYNYLKQNNIPFDKLITDAKTKGDVCEQERIDLFVDDNLNNCYDIKRHNIDCLVFDHLLNKGNNDFKRVYNFEDVYNYVRGVMKWKE